MKLDAWMVDHFWEWLRAAEADGEPEPTAMTVATVDSDGAPAQRTVLVKSVDERGFVFFTNLNSAKGQQLAVDDRISLCFAWKKPYRQVTVAGRVRRVDDKEADAYWQTRDRVSQIGAWASQQSEPLADMATLHERVAAVEARFGVTSIPRPPHWSGLLVDAHMIEFWEGKPYRLHDRLRYFASDSGWREQRLFP